MEFTMTVNMDKAAFEDEATAYGELVRLLRTTAVLVDVDRASVTHKTIMDSNGNRVGEWSIR